MKWPECQRHPEDPSRNDSRVGRIESGSDSTVRPADGWLTFNYWANAALIAPATHLMFANNASDDERRWRRDRSLSGSAFNLLPDAYCCIKCVTVSTKDQLQPPMLPIYLKCNVADVETRNLDRSLLGSVYIPVAFEVIVQSCVVDVTAPVQLQLNRVDCNCNGIVMSVGYDPDQDF